MAPSDYSARNGLVNVRERVAVDKERFQIVTSTSKFKGVGRGPMVSACDPLVLRGSGCPGHAADLERASAGVSDLDRNGVVGI